MAGQSRHKEVYWQEADSRTDRQTSRRVDGKMTDIDDRSKSSSSSSKAKFHTRQRGQISDKKSGGEFRSVNPIDFTRIVLNFSFHLWTEYKNVAFFAQGHDRSQNQNQPKLFEIITN